jgi:hypothetical protein
MAVSGASHAMRFLDQPRRANLKADPLILKRLGRRALGADARAWQIGMWQKVAVFKRFSSICSLVYKDASGTETSVLSSPILPIPRSTGNRQVLSAQFLMPYTPYL